MLHSKQTIKILHPRYKHRSPNSIQVVIMVTQTVAGTKQ